MKKLLCYFFNHKMKEAIRYILVVENGFPKKETFHTFQCKNCGKYSH